MRAEGMKTSQWSPAATQGEERRGEEREKPDHQSS